MFNQLLFENTLIFFDGKVVLRNFIENGKKMTMGFMSIGDYRWFAEDPERFLIIGGCATFTFNDEIRTVKDGDEIFVPAGTTFTMSVTEALDYRCYYA